MEVDFLTRRFDPLITTQIRIAHILNKIDCSHRPFVYFSFQANDPKVTNMDPQYDDSPPMFTDTTIINYKTFLSDGFNNYPTPTLLFVPVLIYNHLPLGL